jgi:uncharacterized protein involved in exopolysaccharide biosynthesis/Mrp family chromosome partitioning ATPase
MTAAVFDSPGRIPKESRQPLRSSFTLRELVSPIFYHRGLAILAFAIPVALAVVVSLLLHPVFTAQSRLLILPGDDYVYRADAAGSTNAQSLDRAQIVQAEMEILSGESLRKAAIEAEGLAKVYPDLAGDPQAEEKAVVRLAKDLKLENATQSNVVDVSFRGRNATVAADFVNKLVELYIARRRAIFQQANPTKIEGERDQMQARLSAIDGQIAALADRYAFGDYDQALAAAQTQQASLASEVESLDAQLASRAGRIAQITQKLKTVAPAIQLYTDQARSQQIESLTENLLALQKERREAAAKYTDGYPLVADLDRRIATIQAQIRGAPSSQIAGGRIGVNPTRQQLDGELADGEGELAGLKKGRGHSAEALAQADAHLKALVDIGPQYRELVRSRAVVEAAYNDLAKRSEDAKLQDSLARARANVRVIQTADPPVTGKTGRLLVLGLGVLLGLACATASVLFAEAFSEVMAGPHELERKLDVPALLAVPWRPDLEEGRRGFQTPLMGAYLTADDAAVLTRLAQSLAKAAHPVIQFVAAESGVGLSSLALDLALQSARRRGRKVLVMDVEPADGLGAVARLEQAGFAVLRQPGRRIMQVESTNLYVSPPVGSHELHVDDTQWREVLENARETYDLIIVDCPAADRSNAGAVIAPYADLCLLVVEAERTRAAVARNLIDRLQAAGGAVSGAVLNKRRFYIPPAIYDRL